MFDIQQKFMIQSHYNSAEIAEKFAAFAANEETDLFGVKHYYIEALDETTQEECPILCKVYPNTEGCELQFVVGDKHFWAKKIQFLPPEPEKFVFKSVAYFAFLMMMTAIHFVMLPVGILAGVAAYTFNTAYPRDAYNRYKKVCQKQKKAMENLFLSPQKVDMQVRKLIDEIGT